MRCFLVMLLCSLFGQLQCQDSDHFIVSRSDTQEAICIQPHLFNYYMFPTFNLDQLQFPPNAGIMHWDWISDWQFENDTNVRAKDGQAKVFIAKDHPFQFVTQTEDSLFILASGVSLWLAAEKSPHGSGILVELDYGNGTNKITRVKYCDGNPESQEANCTVLHHKERTEHLIQGYRWTQISINMKENNSGVEIYEARYGRSFLIAQWTWSNANISNPLVHGFSIFAKTHRSNAVFWANLYEPESPVGDYVPPQLENNKVMKRNYTHRNSGEFCFRVNWGGSNSNDLHELIELKNLASGQVKPPSNDLENESYSTVFRWNHLDAGEYQITLRWNKIQPRSIELCQVLDASVVRKWVSIPKVVRICHYAVGGIEEYRVRLGRSHKKDIQPRWTLDEWAYVCDRLGIGSNDTEVPIEFCIKEGCNGSTCPRTSRLD